MVSWVVSYRFECYRKNDGLILRGSGVKNQYKMKKKRLKLGKVINSKGWFRVGGGNFFCFFFVKGVIFLKLY